MSTMMKDNIVLSKVLVVDDNPIATESLRLALQSNFVVECVDSGEACLDWLAKQKDLPSLILLDIEMDGIDGFETCSRLRATYEMPVIFVSSHDDLSERIKAFDSGGDDFVIKPFEPEVVLRKAEHIVEFHKEKKALALHNLSLQTIAQDYRAQLGETSVLLGFMRSSLALTDFDDLAQQLFEATAEYHIHCHILVRGNAHNYTLTPNGKASPLEESILEKSALMGRTFQFSRRFVVNYDNVLILITDLPDDAEKAKRLCDNIVILAESAEAIAESITTRKEMVMRASSLQIEIASTVEDLLFLYREQQFNTRTQFDALLNNLEHAFVTMDLTGEQENSLKMQLHDGIEQALKNFEISTEIDQRLNHILHILKPPSMENQLIRI